MLFEERTGKCFHEYVHGVFVRWEPLEKECSLLNMFSYEVVAHINVLRVNVVTGFSGQRDGTGVVHVDYNGKREMMRDLIHRPSWITCVTAMYSASVEERA